MGEKLSIIAILRRFTGGGSAVGAIVSCARFWYTEGKYAFIPADRAAA